MKNEYIVTINNRKHSVKILDDGKVEINGKSVDAGITEISSQSFLIRYNNTTIESAVNKLNQNRFGILLKGRYFDSSVCTKLEETANEIMMSKSKSSHKSEIKAPMPGLILKLLKQKNDEVEIGDPLFILEAMKMENEIRSTKKGKIKEILVKEKSPVEKDAIVLVLE